MPHYLVKCPSGTFHADEQPEGFKALGAMENRFFMCECPTPPNGDFVVEMPDEQAQNQILYLFKNGKPLLWDPFSGAVQFSDERDAKGRKTIIYSQAQLDAQLAFMKWIALNVWIPDKQRIYGMSDEVINEQIAKVNALTDPELARVFIVKNLYYDL
jgi:hypothetical protein